MIKKEVFFDEVTGKIFKTKNNYIGSTFDQGKGYLFWNRKNNSKTFKDISFPKEMKWEDIGRITVLTKYVYSNTNMLGYRGNGGVKLYDIKGISKIVELSEKCTNRYINKMIKLGVMAKVKVIVAENEEYQYYINPLYFFSNNWLPLNLYLIFREQLDCVLPKWVIDNYLKENNKL